MFFYINLLIIKPFLINKEKETNEKFVDTDFTVSLGTAMFGKLDNESPPLIFFFNIPTTNQERNNMHQNFKFFLTNQLL